VSKRYKAKRRARYYDTCQRCGAIKNGTVNCYLPEPARFQGTEYHWVERTPDERLCCDCAPMLGYCRSCGEFWGGVESFEFLHPGLCDHCYDEIRQDMYEFEPEDEYAWDEG
jgi:hypothetical protein